MKTTYNAKGEEISEWEWEVEDAAADSGAAADEAAVAGCSGAAASAGDAEVSAEVKGRQEAASDIAKSAAGGAKKAGSKKSSGAAAAKGSAKVSGWAPRALKHGQLAYASPPCVRRHMQPTHSHTCVSLLQSKAAPAGQRGIMSFFNKK